MLFLDFLESFLVCFLKRLDRHFDFLAARVLAQFFNLGFYFLMEDFSNSFTESMLSLTSSGMAGRWGRTGRLNSPFWPFPCGGHPISCGHPRSRVFLP